MIKWIKEKYQTVRKAVLTVVAKPFEWLDCLFGQISNIFDNAAYWAYDIAEKIKD